MSLASFGVKKPVAANLLMLVIIGAGVIFGLSLRREFFPEVRPNEVVVLAPYPGASPDEVERSLAIKIEDQITDVSDIKEIRTTIVEGLATVRIEFEPGVEIEDAVARIKREIDALQDLPENSERITVADFEPQFSIIMLTLHGDADERTMKQAVQRMRDDLRTLPDMGDIVLSGVRTDEISVEVRPEALIEHGLSLPAVSQRVHEAMTQLPGGAVRTPTSIVSIRTIGVDERADEVRRIVVKADKDGRPIQLGEIADVHQGFKDVELRTRLNNEPCASLAVYGRDKQDIIKIAGMIKAYVAGRDHEPLTPTWSERLAMKRRSADKPPRIQAYELGLAASAPPPGELTVHNDLSRFISQRLNLLTRNALWGGMLVFLTLLIFLTPRVAFWVTVGLIISLLGTLAVMRLVGISLNLLTMFGLIVVLGLLVDDAIVVAENITTAHERGEPAIDAAIHGTQQVTWPVLATMLTTICAFLPLRMIEGRLGDLLGALPIVVFCALSVSILEAMLILPSHMAHDMARADRMLSKRRPIADLLEKGRSFLLYRMLLPVYRRFLNLSIARPYLTIAAGIAILIGSLGMVAGGRIPFTFLVASDSELIVGDLHMPIGTPLRVTNEIAKRIEAVCSAMPETQTVLTVVGASQSVDGDDDRAQSHLAQFWMELKPVEDRTRRSSQVIDAIEAQIGVIPGVKSLRFEELQGGPSGADITFTVVSDQPKKIPPVYEAIKRHLREFEGVYDIADDADTGQRELRLTLREGASELGFTTDNLARQLRAAVFGLEAHTFAGNREDIDVRVMLDERTRRSMAGIESMQVFTPEGKPVPIGEVVTLHEQRSFATIRRLNRRRAITISADVHTDIANTEQIAAAMRPMLRELEAQTPGVRIIPRGRQQDMADSFKSLPLGMLAALGMIYVTLAWLFSSYVQPLIVLMTVPFAAVGAIWGHLLMGYEMTMLSLIGFVALMGIVVNDSLILVEFYNHARADGADIPDALRQAGAARFRAILLTTLTTILGLSPLMLEQSFQARFLIPMAITISFGLAAATLVTLILLPAFIIAQRDMVKVLRYLWTGGAPSNPLQPAPIDPRSLKAADHYEA